MKTQKTTVPTTVTWFRMLWMILTQNPCLGPYLKQWQEENPYRSLKFSVTGVTLTIGGCLMLNEARLGGEIGLVMGILGGFSVFGGLVLGILKSYHFTKTIISFQYIWNGQKLVLLANDKHDYITIREIMEPTNQWATQVCNLEKNGNDCLPKGRREKTARKRKINTYVSACIGMGLGHGALTHKKLVEKVFHFAQSN